MNPLPAIKIRRLRPENDADIPLPRYMTAQSAGMDVCAANPEDWVLKPGKIKLVPTGFAMALADGFEAQIRPRSGLAIKHGITLINSPGTIDADYRGEVKIALINLGAEPYTICRGTRIAQMVIHRVHQAEFQIVDQLDATARNDSGIREHKGGFEDTRGQGFEWRFLAATSRESRANKLSRGTQFPTGRKSHIFK